METIGKYAPQIVAAFNFCEAMLWISVGVTFGVLHHRRGGLSRLRFAIAVLFVTFGLSDLVEIRTGSWYDPPWMFAWKALNCAALFVALFLLATRTTSRSR